MFCFYKKIYDDKYIYLFQKVIDNNTGKEGIIKRFNLLGVNNILVLFSDGEKKLYVKKMFNLLTFKIDY